MTIKVQGETYDSAEEVLDAAQELEAKLDELPESSPQRLALLVHIERLREAANGDSLGSPQTAERSMPESSDDPRPSAPASQTELDETTDEPEEYPEPDETPALALCPVCAQPWDLPELPPIDPNTERCSDCDGYGKVITGSRVEGHVWRECKKCQASGFIEKTAITFAPPATGVAEQPGWQGARWDDANKQWLPPVGQEPPWSTAVWDSMRGTWS